jgi:hypothetical protein
MRPFVSLSCSREDDWLASERLVLGLVPSRSGAQDRLVLGLVLSRSGAQDRLVLCLVPSKRAFAMALSPLGRGGSPDGLAIPFRLQLVEPSQLAQYFSGLLQPACAHVRTRYAESTGLGVALRTPVVLGH